MTATARRPRLSDTAREVLRHAKARAEWPGVTIAIDDGGGRFRFDAKRAQLACDFFEDYLVHFEGEHAGEPFRLLPWQRELVIRPLFGWMREDGTRRFRRVFLEIGKKNGKSGLCSGLGLLLAFADGEPGAQVYCAAGAEEQARIVFRPSAEMARASSTFREDFGVEVLVNAIEQARSASFLRPLTSKAKTQHGLNVHGLVFDEFHAQRDRELWETLYRGISARRQPVVAIITTAGDDRESICYEEYSRACKVRDGALQDETYLPVIFEALPTDDWTDESTWRKANPSLGATKKLDYMRSECAAAQAEPRKRNSFLRLELNVWTESHTIWIPPERWAACESKERPDPSRLVATAGLDLSANTDLTALVVACRRQDDRPMQEVGVDPGDARHPERTLSIDYTVDLYTWFFLPREILHERARKDRIDYPLWSRDGWLRVTEGNVVDHETIRRVVMDEIKPRFKGLREIGYDPWSATQLATQLQADGVPMAEVRQGFGSLSAPSKLFEALVLSGRLTHPGSPLLTWCVGNTEIASDPAGNIKPVKPGGEARGTKRIDGVVAAVTALSRLMQVPEQRRFTGEVRVLRW